MAASLTVKYWVSEVEAHLQSYDLKVEAVSATDMPTEVFVLQRGVAPALRPGAGPTDVFQCIADPVDLEEFPVDVPDLANEMPYYRVAEVMLRFRSMSELDEVRDGIGEDLQGLVDALKIAASLTVFEEITYA